MTSRKVKIIATLSAICMLLPCLSACRKTDMATDSFIAMDTVVSVKISTEGVDAEKLFSECRSIVTEKYEAIFSAKRADSALSRYNADFGRDAPEELLGLLDKAISIAEKTNGAFDPALLELSTLWNVTGGGPVPSDDDVKEALNKSTLGNKSAKYDLGAIAKGYILQKICDFLQKEGVKYGTVSIGGNVGVFGEKPDHTKWQVGLRSPSDADAFAGIYSIEDGYISVSGDYERFFEENGVRYHHILDPKTGYPVNNGVHSVSVYCKDAALGDALSTALFVMGVQEGLAFYDRHIYEFEAVFLTDDGAVMTPGAEECFTLSE